VLPGRPTGRGTNTRPGSSGIRIQTPSRVDHHRAAVAPLAWIHAGAEMDQSKGDPFDRLLIAQALDQGYTIVSHDGAFDAFGVPVLRA